MLCAVCLCLLTCAVSAQRTNSPVSGAPLPWSANTSTAVTDVDGPVAVTTPPDDLILNTTQDQTSPSSDAEGSPSASPPTRASVGRDATPTATAAASTPGVSGSTTVAPGVLEPPVNFPESQAGTTGRPASDRDPPAKIPIYLSAYFSMGEVWDGSGILPACEMALEHINQRPDVLPGYDLRMIWNDTKCEAGLGTRVLFDQLYRKPQKIMILGPACSTATQAVAETAYFWNLVTMSYAAASSALSNRKKYPFFYRTYMPDAMYNPSRIRLIQEFGWKRVATIHENHQLFSLAIDDLLTLLRVADIAVISSESFSEDPKNQIENLKNQDARIILGNMYEDKARRVFCEAYKRGMTGPDYVWMIIGWYQDKWWAVNDVHISCTVREMAAAVEQVQYFSTESLQLSTSTQPTVAGITPVEYETLLRERMTWPENSGYLWNTLAPYGYDAAWAIALALNSSVEVLKTETFSDGNTRRLEDFTYDDREMAELFFYLLNKTEFDGVSGPVGFMAGDRIGITQIEQLQGHCEEGWHLTQSSCFYLVSDPALTSAEAAGRCRARLSGATLATVASQKELEFLIETWRSHPEALPGQWLVTALPGMDSEMDTSWEQTDNPTNESGGGACVVVDLQNGGRWQTTDCGNRFPYICHVHAEFTETQIALYNTIHDTVEWRKDIVWPGGGPPLDRTPTVIVQIVRQYQGVSPTLYFIVCGVAAVCILFSLCFLAFNIRYRQQRHVKMSSPNLNNLIIFGAVLVYVFVIAAGLDTNLAPEDIVEIMCHVKTWFLSVGFVLAFGAMFSKTWRVHRVAAFKTPRRRIVTDKQLILMVFVLLLIDVIILTMWQVIDPLTMETLDLYQLEDPETPNTVIQPFVQYCTCDTLTYWLGALYSYKGLLLIFGTFLAWETRKVSIPGLNDSKLIGISVYNVVILCMIGVAVSFVISQKPEALFLFVSGIILFCTSITLIVVFVPKIIAVVKYPDGDPAAPSSRSRTNNNGVSELGNSTASMVAENRELKDTITKLERQIQNVTRSGPEHMSGKVCECWSCGLVCGFPSSREKDYSPDSATHETNAPHVDEQTDYSRNTAMASL